MEGVWSPAASEQALKGKTGMRERSAAEPRVFRGRGRDPGAGRDVVARSLCNRGLGGWHTE